MTEASSPQSMDIDVVVDLHTSNVATAAAAAQALLNETSSNASSDAGFNIKIPVLYTSSSDTETDDYHILRNRMQVGDAGNGSSTVVATAATSISVEGVRSSSPPPNCAICLGRCKNKCFTDSCVHQFCFKCLCEWSKVKAECPLCKQAFRSIIHNVKAIDQYEEYLVQQPVVQIPHSPLEVTYQSPLNGGFIFNGTRRYYNFSMRSWPSQAGHNVMGSRGGPITIRNYMPDDELTIPSAAVAVNPVVENMRRSELLDLYRQELPDEISSTMSLSQLWRRYIYDRKLYALPVSDITGRYRESSARFYRNNPGQRVRLIPFANRDIVCLLRNTNHDVSTVLESLNEGLEFSNILSRSFRRRLQPYLGERTAHFIHELSNFARSPYDMIGYDRAVQYAPQVADEDHVIEFSSSSDEEANNNSEQSENINTTNTVNLSSNDAPASASAYVRSLRRNLHATSTTSRSRNAGTSEFRVQSRSSAQAGMHSPMSLLSFTITTTSEGSETPGLSVAVSAGSRGHAQVAAINLSTHNRAHNEVVIDLDDTVELNGSSNGEAASATNANISNVNTIGNNDIALPAPTANLMPEGSPQVVASIALSTSSSDECEFVLERKPPHLRTPEMVSLNSESDSDVVFVDETKPIMAEATYSTSENEERATLSRLISEQQDQQQPSTSTGLRSRTLRQLVATKRQSTSSQRQESSPSKKRRMRTRRINTPPGYNSDESTSDDNGNGDDSEYNAKRHLRGRTTGRKRGTRTRSGNSSRRNQKKRQRSVNPRNEMLTTTQNADQDSNTTITNEPITKKKRVSTKCDSNGSKSAQNYNSSTKHSSSSDDGSSTEEDDEMNLKALQLRLKKSLSDVEDNMKPDTRDYTSIYSPPTRYDEMSRESNLDTASFRNSFNINNNNHNNNKKNNNNNNDEGNDDVYRNSLQDGPSCSNSTLRRQKGAIIAPKLIAGTTPPPSPQRPTTSAAAAAAAAIAAATAVASISNFKAARAYSEESNASEQEETQAHHNLGSMSPASLSPSSVEPQAMAHVYDNNTLGSISSMESYQLPCTSRKHVHSYSPSKAREPLFNAHLNDSDSSNSSTTSSSSASSSGWSGSEAERDSEEHPLA